MLELGKKLEFWNVHEFSRPGWGRPRLSLEVPRPYSSKLFRTILWLLVGMKMVTCIYKIMKKPKTKSKTRCRA